MTDDYAISLMYIANRIVYVQFSKIFTCNNCKSITPFAQKCMRVPHWNMILQRNYNFEDYPLMIR